MNNLAGFLAIAAVLIATPGQDTAVTVRNTIAAGAHAGVATAAGVALGQALWTILTAVGIAALVTRFAPAFTAIRYIGAAYLIYLGMHALWDAARTKDVADISEARPHRLSLRGAFRRGLLSNITNAKMAAFFPSLLLQFVVPAPGFPAATLLLGLLFATMTLCWLCAYAYAVARAGMLLRRSSVRRTMDAALGAALVGLGLRLALERR